MPKPRAYIETTVPNFYYDFRPSPAIAERREATRRWWADAAERYELVTSNVVLGELARGTSKHVPLRLALLEGIPTIPFLPLVTGIIQTYLHHKLMPTNPPDDAWHLALASFHKCDLICDVELPASCQSQQGGPHPTDQHAAGIVGAAAGDSAGIAQGGEMSDDWTAADDAVEEVRKLRRRLWAQFDNDVEKIAAYYMELDKQNPGRMIDPRKRDGLDQSALMIDAPPVGQENKSAA